MAWYAELKRRNWYCIKEFDAISWYSQYAYEEWYSSLTNEEKKKLEEAKRKKEEERCKDINTSIAKLMIMTGIISEANTRTNEEKYHGIYDENGFPKI